MIKKWIVRINVKKKPNHRMKENTKGLKSGNRICETILLQKKLLRTDVYLK